MTSLKHQMKMLQKQQVILNDKIKEDKERKTKDSYTIQTLQKLNKQQSESIKKFTAAMGEDRTTCSNQINLITAPRFEVILEILKKQDARIQELEEFIELI